MDPAKGIQNALNFCPLDGHTTDVILRAVIFALICFGLFVTNFAFLTATPRQKAQDIKKDAKTCYKPKQCIYSPDHDYLGKERKTEKLIKNKPEGAR
jgi:hypothetical protein